MRRIISTVEVLCFMNIYLKAMGMYINPGYEHHDRYKDDHTNICVQIQPNGANIPEPYYMCKGPEFPERKLNVPTTFFRQNGLHTGMFNHFPVSNIANFIKPNEGNDQSQALALTHVYLPRQQFPFVAPQFHHHLTSSPFVPLMPDQLNFVQNEHENSQQANLDSRRSDNSADESMQNYESKLETTPQYIDQPNNESSTNNFEQLPGKIDNGNINPEQFNALLKDEVLGAPNLVFLSDEMLPIQNMPTSRIPPEYQEDPILRTFYNIDHSPTEESYFSPTKHTQEYNPLSPESFTLEGNSNYYRHAQTPTESVTPNKCFEFPLNYQHVFIAIPWLISPPYHNLLANMPLSSCGQESNSQHDHEPSNNKDLNFHDNYRSQVDIKSVNSSSTEDLSNQNSTIRDVQIGSRQSEASSTNNPISSEEDLFVEGTTIAAEKLNTTDEQKSIEDTQSTKDEVSTATTGIPHTTVRTFKTMLHNARMHAMGLGGINSSNQQVQNNKRNIPHMDGGDAEPSNTKKQYVTKLENDVEI